MDEAFVRETLQPKPFVFVVMPFDKAFDDIYKFGIKGAAEDVGAYAERLDDQIFSGPILERVFNQISRADVIVADTSGRNANVFYEIGYAHALGKVVLLLTQHSEDIPFDLKHRQHVVYGGSIDMLRRDLRTRLAWAIREAASRQSPLDVPSFAMTLNGIELARGFADGALPTIPVTMQSRLTLPSAIRNDSLKSSPQFTHVYLFCEKSSLFVPFEFVEQTVMRPQASHDSDGRTRVEQVPVKADIPRLLQSYAAAPADVPDHLDEQYRLANVVLSMPPGAVEYGKLQLAPRESARLKGLISGHAGRYRLRLHGESGIHDFSFAVELVSAETRQGEP